MLFPFNLFYPNTLSPLYSGAYLTWGWIFLRLHVVVVIVAAVGIDVVLLQKRHLFFENEFSDVQGMAKFSETQHRLWEGLYGKFIYFIARQLSGFGGQLFGAFARAQGLPGGTTGAVSVVVWKGEAETRRQALHGAPFRSPLCIVALVWKGEVYEE